MRISRVAKLEKELFNHKPRKRAIFPQIRCDSEFIQLVKNKKNKLKLTWEDAIIDMGMEWLKKQS
jgi:hypothetical protein